MKEILIHYEPVAIPNYNSYNPYDNEDGQTIVTEVTYPAAATVESTVQMTTVVGLQGNASVGSVEGVAMGVGAGGKKGSHLAPLIIPPQGSKPPRLFDESSIASGVCGDDVSLDSMNVTSDHPPTNSIPMNTLSLDPAYTMGPVTPGACLFSPNSPEMEEIDGMMDPDDASDEEEYHLGTPAKAKPLNIRPFKKDRRVLVYCGMDDGSIAVCDLTHALIKINVRALLEGEYAYNQPGYDSKKKLQVRRLV